MQQILKPKNTPGKKEISSLLTITLTARVLASVFLETMTAMGNTVWYGVVISLLIGSVPLLLLWALLSLYPDTSLDHILLTALGPVVGHLALLLYALLFFSEARLLLHSMVSATLNHGMPGTPSLFITLCIVGAVGIAIYIGISPLTRFAHICSRIILVALLPLLIFGLAYAHTEFLFPIAGYGVPNTIVHSLSLSAGFSQIVGLGYLAGALGKKQTMKAGSGALIKSGILCVLLLLIFSMDFPYSASETPSVYKMGSVLQQSPLSSGVETLYLLVFDGALLFSIAGSMYFCTHSFASTLHIPPKRALLPLMILLLLLSMLGKSLSVRVNNFFIMLENMRYLLYAPPLLLALAATWLQRRLSREKKVLS